MTSPETVTLYRWQVNDTTSPWRKKRGDPWRTLPNAMTEADAADYARKEGVELRQVPGSAETRTPVSGATGSLYPARELEALREHKRRTAQELKQAFPGLKVHGDPDDA